MLFCGGFDKEENQLSPEHVEDIVKTAFEGKKKYLERIHKEALIVSLGRKGIKMEEEFYEWIDANFPNWGESIACNNLHDAYDTCGGCGSLGMIYTWWLSSEK